jgi:hypothetical protein
MTPLVQLALALANVFGETAIYISTISHANDWYEFLTPYQICTWIYLV